MKPTVFNYQDFVKEREENEKLKQENDALRRKLTNAEIALRIAKAEIERLNNGK